MKTREELEAIIRRAGDVLLGEIHKIEQQIEQEKASAGAGAAGRGGEAGESTAAGSHGGGTPPVTRSVCEAPRLVEPQYGLQESGHTGASRRRLDPESLHPTLGMHDPYPHEED